MSDSFTHRTVQALHRPLFRLGLACNYGIDERGFDRAIERGVQYILKRPRGWDGPIMTAVDCYRFCLSSPHVDLTLTGPVTREQLDESLDALEKGPLSPDEERAFRGFGAFVHGGRT